MSAAIEIRCTRRFRNGGRLLAVGEVIAVEPREAAEALASGRMTLVNAHDAAIVNQAMRTHIQRTLTKLGRAPIDQ